METAGWRYRAFISYSQKDKTEASRLHRWLESYRVPRGVLPPAEGARKLGRFFRDDEEMGAAADIGATVRGAIEDSQCLIVLCSPRSAKSKWVNAEILHFRHSGRGDKIFAVIVDGVPNAIDPELECFPPALRAGVDPYNPEAMPIEPLGLDLRKEGRARACARLAAGLLDVEFDKLWQRERKRRDRRRLLIACAAAGLPVALGSAIGVIDRTAARDALSARAILLEQQGERTAAMPFALAALGGQRPEADQVATALGGNFPLIAVISSPDRTAKEFQFSPDGRTLGVRLDDDQLTLWNADTGARLGANVPSVDLDFVSDRVVTLGDSSGDILNAHTGALVQHLPKIFRPSNGDTYTAAGDTLVAGLGDIADAIGVWNLSDGRMRLKLQVPDLTSEQDLSLSKDGTRLFICSSGPRCSFWDLTTGKLLLRNVAGYSPKMSDDGSVLAVQFIDGVTVWDGDGRKIRDFAGRANSWALAPDGMHLAIATRKDAKLFDTATGRVVADLGIVADGAADTDDTIGGPFHLEESDAFSFSSDGSRLLVKGYSGAAALWDVRAARVIMRVGADEATWTFTSPTFKALITESFRRESVLWDGSTGQKIGTIPLDDGESMGDTVFSDGGGLVVLKTNSIAPNNPGAMTLWRYNGEKLADFGERGSIGFFQISTDGHRLAAMLSDGNVALWDATSFITGRGEDLRGRICKAARGAEPPFTASSRDDKTVVAYLRGRPWNPCDWRSLNEGAGWAQMLRYWLVRIGAPWDYSPSSCRAAGTEFGCPAEQ